MFFTIEFTFTIYKLPSFFPGGVASQLRGRCGGSQRSGVPLPQPAHTTHQPDVNQPATTDAGSFLANTESFLVAVL
jgi:hypothetical protein